MKIMFAILVVVVTTSTLFADERQKQYQQLHETGRMNAMLWYPEGFIPSKSSQLVYYSCNTDKMMSEIILQGTLAQIPLVIKRELDPLQVKDFVDRLNYYITRGKLRLPQRTLREINSAINWYVTRCFI